MLIRPSRTSAALTIFLLCAALLLVACSDPPPETSPQSAESPADVAQASQPQPAPAVTAAPKQQAATKPEAPASTPEPPPQQAEAEELPATSTPQLEAAASNPTKLHAGPGVDWAVRRTIQPDDTLTILGRAQWGYDSGETWLKVELSDGGVGWLRAEHLGFEPAQLDDVRVFKP